MVAHLTRMALQPCEDAQRVHERPGSFEELFEWDLRVDDDLLAARQVNEKIRSEPPVVGEEASGLLEVGIRCSTPAIWTTRRSCSSPQRPRTAGVRSHWRVSWPTSRARRSVPTSGHMIPIRSRSTSLSRWSTRFSVSAIGLTIGLERSLGEIEKRRTVVVESLSGERLKRVAQSLISPFRGAPAGAATSSAAADARDSASWRAMALRITITAMTAATAARR